MVSNFEKMFEIYKWAALNEPAATNKAISEYEEL